MRFSNIAKVAIFTEFICKKLSASFQENSIIDNIVNKWSFSLWILEMPKFDEKTGSYMWIKKAVQPKNESVFNFMIYPPNDKSEVVNRSLLAIPKAEMRSYPSINNITTDVKFKLVETLL